MKCPTLAFAANWSAAEGAARECDGSWTRGRVPLVHEGTYIASAKVTSVHSSAVTVRKLWGNNSEVDLCHNAGW